MDPNVQGVMVVIGAVLQQIDLTLRDHFEHAAAGDEGYSGEDFAMWFCDNRIAVPAALQHAGAKRTERIGSVGPHQEISAPTIRTETSFPRPMPAARSFSPHTGRTR